MAQSKNSRKCEGLCQKIKNAVSPFRSRNRNIPHQPQEKPPSQTTEKPVKSSSPERKPVHALPQPSSIKVIPIECGRFPAQGNKAWENFTPLVENAGKENSGGRPGQESDERDIPIVRGQKFTKSSPRKKEVATPEGVEKVAPPPDKHSNHVQFPEVGSKKDDDSIHYERRFTEYINKVRHGMMKTVSNVGVEKSLSHK